MHVGSEHIFGVSRNCAISLISSGYAKLGKRNMVISSVDFKTLKEAISHYRKQSSEDLSIYDLLVGSQIAAYSASNQYIGPIPIIDAVELIERGKAVATKKNRIQMKQKDTG
jgi:hypothetical protein